MIHIITVAFSNFHQFDKAMCRFWKMPRGEAPFTHWVISGHYPLNHDINEAKIKTWDGMFEQVRYLDPGSDLGSAQTQNWALDQIKPGPDDFVVNLDPDSACDVPGWLDAMRDVMYIDSDLGMVHLTNPYVWERIRFGYHPFTFEKTGDHNLAIPIRPEQFNITMYRVKMLDKIGGIKQLSPFYGNVEGAMFQLCRDHNYYSAYLTDYIEAYDLKSLEDPQLWHYKKSHCHHERFNIPYFGGRFGEFCKLQGYV